MEYRYPGNVRELENAIEHAFVICAGATIGVEDLPPHIRDRSLEPEKPDPRAVHLGPLESAEAVVIHDGLARHNGNRTRAAQKLGISRNTLWRKMKKHGVS
jgi:transcriptional regulator of acetoin/glycerol metabolism